MAAVVAVVAPVVVAAPVVVVVVVDAPAAAAVVGVRAEGAAFARKSSGREAQSRVGFQARFHFARFASTQ